MYNSGSKKKKAQKDYGSSRGNVEITFVSNSKPRSQMLFFIFLFLFYFNYF